MSAALAPLAFDLAVMPALERRARNVAPTASAVPSVLGSPRRSTETASYQAAASEPAASEPAAPEAVTSEGVTFEVADAGAAELMRAINVAIVRPSFLAVLFGAPVVAVGAAILAPSPLTITAAVLQTAGLVVTIAVNVPLNDALARDSRPGAYVRFARPWRRAHRVRTIAALAAAALGAVA